METFVVTLTGSAQQLSETNDRWIEELSIQPDGNNANPCFIGHDNTVSTSNYGVRLPASDAGEPPPPWTTESNGPSRLRLTDIWVIGTGAEVLHITVQYGKTLHKVS